MAEQTIFSPTERRIRQALANNPHRQYLVPMAADLERVVQHWQQEGLHPQMQAAAAVTHTVAMLTALKITALVPAEFIDLLVDDLVDSVKGRAHPGVPEWLTPQ